MSLLRLFNLFGSDPAKIVNVDNANTARTTSTVVAATQNIDATGKVSPAGDAVGNAPFTKITDGTDTALVTANGELKTLNSDILLEIAKGNVAGAKMHVIPGVKYNVATTLYDDISELSVATIPTPNGIQLQLVSTSANDTAAGTGIRTVSIHYLDSNYDEQEETVTMNGVTAVNTVATNIQRVQWIHAETVGSGGVAAGIINIQNLAGTVIYDLIWSGGNQSLKCMYTVPNNKTGYILGWQATGITNRVDIKLRATVDRFTRVILPGVFCFQDQLLLNDTASGYIPFEVPLKCPEKTDIKVSAYGLAVNTDVSACFHILLIDD